jgi:hypothetical protein
MTLHNKQKIICYVLAIVAVAAIPLLGSSLYSSSVSALPSFPTIDHHKAFVKNQDSSTSNSALGTKGSHNSISEHNGDDNSNDRGINDPSNTNPENNLQTTEPADSSNRDHSTSTDGATTNDDTPFVLSLPFP